MKRRLELLAILLIAMGLIIGFNSPGLSAMVPYTNTRISVDSSGAQVNSTVDGRISMSRDGRYVEFFSDATNLVSSDTNSKIDIFVKDRTTGSVILANVSSSGAQITSQDTTDAKISGNGRYVSFYTSESLDSVDTNNTYDLYLRDLQANTTELVTKNISGTVGNGASGGHTFDLSSDGRFIVFESSANNLVSGDTNNLPDIFVKDRKLNTIKLLSKSDLGNIGNDQSIAPSISCDGSVVAFWSSATNLVGGYTKTAANDIYIVQRVGDDTVANITYPSNGQSTYPRVSCDGSTVSFNSTASNLVSSDSNAKEDAFAYNVQDATTELIDVSSSGTQANKGATDALLSEDGRFAVFGTTSSTLVSGDTNGVSDVFLRDRKAGTTEIVSKRNSSTQTNAGSGTATIDSKGTLIAYISNDAGLVPGDTNGAPDVFIANSGTSTCMP